MFITNNYASFHLWWKENLEKYQKSQNVMSMIVWKIFFCNFFFLLTALIVHDSLILAGIYFIFPKTVLDQALKILDIEFGPQ